MGEYEMGAGGGSFIKRREVSIPVLLLILVFVVVAWKLGWLSSLPVIGDVFGSPALSVLLVGDEANVRNQLEAIKTDLHINIDIIQMDEAKALASPDFLKKYSVVFLTEKLAANGADLPDTFRNYLGKYLEGNGKLVLYGVAGSTDPDSAQTNGWASPLVRDFIPVRCRFPGSIEQKCEPGASTLAPANDQVAMRVLQPDNPVLAEFGTSVEFTQAPGGTLPFTPVNVAKGEQLVRIDFDDGSGNIQTYPGLVWYNFGFGGKVVYFAYEPWRTPQLFKNVVKAIK